jgi:hypothetical protein
MRQGDFGPLGGYNRTPADRYTLLEELICELSGANSSFPQLVFEEGDETHSTPDVDNRVKLVHQQNLVWRAGNSPRLAGQATGERFEQCLVRL